MEWKKVLEKGFKGAVTGLLAVLAAQVVANQGVVINLTTTVAGTLVTALVTAASNFLKHRNDK